MIAPTTKCIQTLVLAAVAIGIVVYDRALFFSQAHLAEDKPQLEPVQRSLSAS